MARYSLVVLCLALTACGQSSSVLEQVKQAGSLHVATRNSATTYYEGPEGATGFEYDLAKRFADHLGVGVELVTPSSLGEILAMVERGEVHFAAAGLTVTEPRKRLVRFGPPYQEITQQLVYRLGTKKPRDLADIDGYHLEVVADSSHAENLEALEKDYAALTWMDNPELDSEELLDLVWQQVIDYTVADSNEIALNQRFYPELRVAFDLTEPQPLAWAFPHSDDDSLYQAAVGFFEQLEKSGELAALIERHYGHVDSFDYVGTRTYRRHIKTRLPRFEALFKEAAKDFAIDWRLLAAMGYQESHWNPRARSPTGVRGLMMLTTPTARQLGVENRLDPAQSVAGGAEYFVNLHRRIPERIAEPDRSWLAMAAYNVGLGHLEDARVITQKRGGDPDKWSDVKENLPLLTSKKWYSKTRYGYARGREPVRYVENIRSYYDILVWTTERDKPKPAPEPPAFAISSPAL